MNCSQGASFAENFYGLKRRKVIGSGSDRTKAAIELTGRSEKLGPKEIRASLVFLVSSRRPNLVSQAKAGLKKCHNLDSRAVRAI